MSRRSKIVSMAVVLFLMLGTLVSPALAKGATNVILENAWYVGNKGPVFTFSVNGWMTTEQLRNAAISTPAGNFPFYCVQKNATTVRCTAPKSTAGETDAIVSVGGFAFWTSVPGVRPAPVIFAF